MPRMALRRKSMWLEVQAKVIEKNDGVRIYEEGQSVNIVIDPRDLMSYAPQEEEVAQ